MKAAIYTAITAQYDLLKSQPVIDNELVAFVDSRSSLSGRWQIRPIEVQQNTAKLSAKWYKMMPHKVLPDVDYSLWIDGSILLRPDFSLQKLIDKALTSSDIAMFRHTQRNCIYDEAWECIRRGLDSPERIYRQICEYTKRNFPQNYGLHTATMILRRHTAKVAKLNEAWWKEILDFSTRDQISFEVVASELGITVGTIPGTISRNKYCRKFTHRLEADLSKGESWEEYFLEGLELQNQGDLQGASLSFLRSIAKENTIVDVWLCLGDTLRNLGAYVDAVKAFQKALDLGKRNGEAMQLLALTLRQGGQPQQALQIAELYIASVPEDSWGYVFSAELFLELGRLDEAHARFSEELARDSNSVEALKGLEAIANARRK